jgi:hypothetical protein
MLPPLAPPLLKLLLFLEELLLGLLMLELLLLGVELELLGLLMLELLLELLVLVLLFLMFTDEELFLSFDELGLTYSELERTWRLLLAGVYDLRSEDEEGLTDGELPELEGLLYLF